jgi:hypothetical protein
VIFFVSKTDAQNELRVDKILLLAQKRQSERQIQAVPGHQAPMQQHSPSYVTRVLTLERDLSGP